MCTSNERTGENETEHIVPSNEARQLAHADSSRYDAGHSSTGNDRQWTATLGVIEPISRATAASAYSALKVFLLKRT